MSIIIVAFSSNTYIANAYFLVDKKRTKWNFVFLLQIFILKQYYSVSKSQSLIILFTYIWTCQSPCITYVLHLDALAADVIYCMQGTIRPRFIFASFALDSGRIEDLANSYVSHNIFYSKTLSGRIQYEAKPFAS